MKVFSGFLVILLFLMLIVAGIHLILAALYEIPRNYPNLFNVAWIMGAILIIFGLYFFANVVSKNSNNRN